MEVLQQFDIKAACRLCLQVGPDHPLIFEESGSVGSESPDKLSLQAKISACVGFEINCSENLPSRICNTCLEKVNHWFTFRLQCEGTNNLLTKVLIQGYKILTLSLQSKDASGIINGCPSVIQTTEDLTNSRVSSHLEGNDISSSRPSCSLLLPSEAIANNSSHLSTPKTSVPLDNINPKKEALKDCSSRCIEDDCHQSVYSEHEEHSDNGDYALLSSCDEEEQTEGVQGTPDYEGSNWRHRPVKCPLCNKMFGKHFGVKLHLKVVHQVVKLYPCLICGHVSVVSTEREKHVSNKHAAIIASKKHTCNLCGIHVDTQGSFNRHLKRHEEIRRCKFCESLFEAVESLEEHIRCVHKDDTVEKPVANVEPFYHCHHCENVSFWKERDWRKHYIDVHKTIDVFPCNMCKRAYRTKALLIVHMRQHTGEKPYMCELCATRFTCKPSLRNHMRKHTDRFQCSTCEKTFSSNSGLFHHQQAHKGETPYMCHECGKSFKSRQGLQIHIRAHSGEKPYKCEICDFTSRAASGLYAHKAAHTGEKPFKCDQCDKSFKLKGWLRTHEKTHSGEKNFKCEICDHAFIAMYQLRSHSKTHSGERPFECDVCSKTFARRDGLTEHRRIHTKEMKYSCEHCGDGFMFLKQYKKHLQKCTTQAKLQTSLSETVCV